jgi:signal peptidase II
MQNNMTQTPKSVVRLPFMVVFMLARMTSTRVFRLITLLLVLVCTAGCDQATKHFARTQLGAKVSAVAPGRFVEFRLAENPGAFLSLGASLPQTARTALSLGLCLGLACLAAFLVRTPRVRWLSFLGFALVWAGGISNLVDRFLRHGLVTDFMVVRVGPLHSGVFNLADVAIVVGVFMVVAFSLARSELSVRLP